MDNYQQSTRRPHILWVRESPLDTALDSATWLETTRELRELGWKISLISRGPAGRQRIQGVEVYCLPTSGRYFLGPALFHLRLVNLLLQRWNGIDAILFHQRSAAWLLPLKLLSRLIGAKRPLFVMDTRDLSDERGSFKSHLRITFTRLAHWLANRWADGQTAITSGMAELVGIPAERLWGLWPSGVRLARFDQAQEGRHWPAADQTIHLIYIGKLQAARNMLLLCQAVERANAGGMLFVLSLVGEGPERAKLEQFALQSEGGIRVSRAVPYDQVPELLKQAHVGVTPLPSPSDKKFQASSPIKLFEYMAAGLPILATRNPCHTEVVGNGKFAFWAEDETISGLHAALQLIGKSHSSFGSMGGDAALAAREWTWRASATKLSKALEYGLSLKIDDWAVARTSVAATSRGVNGQ